MKKTTSTQKVRSSSPFNAAMCALDQEDVRAALSHLADAEDSYPQHPYVLFFQGIAREKIGETDAALQLFLTAAPMALCRYEKERDFELKKLASSIYSKIAQALIARGDLDAAETAIENGVDAWPGETVLWDTLAHIREKRGNIPGAVDACFAGYGNDASPFLYARHADLCKSLHWHAEAVRVYRLGVRQHPREYRLWGQLGLALADGGHFKAGARALDRMNALWSNPDPHTINTYAYVLQAAGHSKEARKQALLSISRDSDNSPAWDTLSYVYIGTREYDKAIEAALKAIELDWDEHEAWYHLGVAYSRNNQPGKTREVFNQLVRLDLAWAGLLANQMV